jgi:Flp pilus assembly protein TadD
MPKPTTTGSSDDERLGEKNAAEDVRDMAETLRPPRPTGKRPAARARRDGPPAPKVSASVDIDALYQRALLLADDERFEEAGRLALACIDEAPFDHRAYVLSAIVNEELGRFAIAERMLRRALVLEPSSAEAVLRLELLLDRTRTTGRAG